MTSVSMDFAIPADPARVFDLLVDPQRFSEWQPAHDSWPDGLPVVAVGRSFVQRTRFMGKTTDITWTVNELARPSSIVLEGTGAMGLAVQSAYRLDGGASGTTLRLDSRLDGAPGAMKGLVRRRARATAEESVANLTALLAGDPAVPALPREAPQAHSLVQRLGRFGPPRLVGDAVTALAHALAPPPRVVRHARGVAEAGTRAVVPAPLRRAVERMARAIRGR